MVIVLRSEDLDSRIESTINAENQLLRDQLSRERSFRKAVEADKREIQQQLLESKDRLHHLSNVIQQKDDMLRKLDQVRFLPLLVVAVLSSAGS